MSPKHQTPGRTMESLRATMIFMALSSDILPIDPRVGLYAAVTRKGMSGEVYGPEERITIEEAIRAGAFDDLPGRGKPLRLLNNPYAPGTELAYQLLKDNEYTLPWISERAAVLARIQALREEIAASWPAYQADYLGSANDSQRLEVSQEWSTLLAGWEETIDSINKDITTVNLKQPGEQLEILKLTLNSELSRAGARRALG